MTYSSWHDPLPLCFCLFYLNQDWCESYVISTIIHFYYSWHISISFSYLTIPLSSSVSFILYPLSSSLFITPLSSPSSFHKRLKFIPSDVNSFMYSFSSLAVSVSSFFSQDPFSCRIRFRNSTPINRKRLHFPVTRISHCFFSLLLQP